MLHSSLALPNYNQVLIALLFYHSSSNTPVRASPAGRASIPAPLVYAPPPPISPSPSITSSLLTAPTFALPNSAPSQLYITLSSTPEAQSLIEMKSFSILETPTSAATITASDTPATEVSYAENTPAIPTPQPLYSGPPSSSPTHEAQPIDTPRTSAPSDSTASTSLAHTLLALAELEANNMATTPSPSPASPSTPFPKPPSTMPIDNGNNSTLQVGALVQPMWTRPVPFSWPVPSPSPSPSRTRPYIAHAPTISVDPELCPQNVCKDYVNWQCGRRYGGCWDECKEDREYIDPGCIGWSTTWKCRGCP